MRGAPGVWEQVLAALDRHGRLAMVTLAATRGSAPREAGARMLVNPDGTFTGTIGGGTLEIFFCGCSQDIKNIAAALSAKDVAKLALALRPTLITFLQY